MVQLHDENRRFKQALVESTQQRESNQFVEAHHQHAPTWVSRLVPSLPPPPPQCIPQQPPHPQPEVPVPEQQAKPVPQAHPQQHKQQQQQQQHDTPQASPVGL